MLRKKIAQAVIVLMVAIVAPLATSSAAHAACPTPGADPYGYALPPSVETNCANVPYHVYDGRGHVFAITAAGDPIHTWQGCGTCAYQGSWVGLGGWASSWYRLINYTVSGRLAIEVSVVGAGGTLYCKNYNGNIVGG